MGYLDWNLAVMEYLRWTAYGFLGVIVLWAVIETGLLGFLWSKIGSFLRWYKRGS